MKHGSLFSGIGGFDLAAQWMEWDNKFHCEWNEFGRKILNYYWPNAKSYEDITKTDFTIWNGRIDILTGGFPCQPYSAAGKRLGKEDDRHLWPEMLRAIREIQPTYVVAENVLGLINWNKGLVFHEVQTDLETQGYEVQPFVLPACAIGAPHRRDRVWFVAHRKSEGLHDRQGIDKRKKPKQKGINVWDNSGPISKSGASPNSNSNTTGSSRESGETKGNGSKNNDVKESRGRKTKQYIGRNELLRTTSNAKGSGSKGKLQQRQEEGEFGGLNIKDVTNTDGFRLRGQSDGVGKSRFTDQKGTPNHWENFPTQSPICDGNDGISTRLDTITFPKWRNESIKGGGNAIVPELAFQIFKAIEKTL